MPRSPLLPVFLIVLVDVFGMTLVIPLLAIYAERYGASPLQATLLVSVYALFQLVSGPLLGALSDRVGRKPLLLVSQAGTFIGFIVLARAHVLWVVYLSRIIDGATAGNLSLAQAYISDHVPPERRARSFALIGIAFGIGFFLGPAITGRLSVLSLAAPIYLAAGLSLTSILCTALLLPGGRPPQRPIASDTADLPAGRRLGVLSWGRYAAYLGRPVLGGLLVQFFFYMLAFSTFTSGFALFAERVLHWHGRAFGPREIGYLFAYAGFLGIVLQGGLIGRLVKRFGEPALVWTGFVSLVVGYIALGATRTLPGIVALATLTSYGTGVLRPSLTALISARAERHEQGVVLGLAQSLAALAAVIAPTVAGAWLDHGRLGAWAWTAAAASALGLLGARWGSAVAGRTGHTPP